MNILCFGDSNTWGLIPCVGDRYPREKRWTGILAKLVGEEHYIIEEGLNGRTANEVDEEEPYLNGRAYMEACMKSHRPVHILIVMLGSNDIKSRYNKSSEQIADSIGDLTRDMKRVLDESQKERVKVLLISPKNIDERLLGDGSFDKKSIEKSVELGGLLEGIALKEGWEYIDASKHNVTLGDDGLHISEEGHNNLAYAVYNVISRIEKTNEE